MNEIQDELSNQAKDLFEYSKALKDENISKLFNNYKFSESIIDKAIRKCLLNNKNDSSKKNTMKELLKHANLNYINPEDKTTLIMLVCQYSDKFIIKFILKQEFKREKNITEIDLSKCDNNNCNFIFYIFKNNHLEENALDILNEMLEYNDNLKNPIKTSSQLLLQNDKNGNSPLTIILKKGWEKILNKYFEYVKYQKNNNNLIHCAIDGKKISCLKIILKLSSLEDLKTKNKDGETPSAYANKKQYFFMSKIISSYESNFNNIQQKKLILDKPLSPNEILEYFSKKDFSYCNLALFQYKLNQSIIGDITNIPWEWNNLLVKKNTILSKSQYGIQPEHILSKYISNNKNDFNNDKKQFMNSLCELSKFFYKFLSDNLIADHLDVENYPIDLVIYNKILFYYKIGNVDTTIKTIAYYLTHISSQNENKYYKIIIFENVTFILIELFIKENFNEIAKIIIIKLDLKLKDFIKKQILFDDNEIISYLNNNEIIHPFNKNNPNLKDAFAYITLLKVLNDIENAKKYFIEYKNLLVDNKYQEGLKIFTKLKSIYNMIKVKINYHNNLLSKNLNKISFLRDSLDSIEDKFFFYNSVGIINLKLKNFHFAEMLFKTGIQIYKSFNMNSYSKIDTYDDGILQKNEYLCFMKFNLGLSLFYQRKFKDAYIIFKELINIKSMNKNIYLWYRLGISSLEIYIENMKKILNSVKKEKKDKNIVKKNEENGGKEKNNIEKKFGYEYDELFTQFEEEYGNNCIKGENNNERNQKQKMKLRKFFFQSNSNDNKYKDYLNEAISYFKNVLYIEKKNTNYEISLNLNVENIRAIRGIYNYYTKSIGEDNDFKNLLSSSKKKGNEQIIFLTYLNLLFSLSLSKKYTEMLLVIKNIKQQKFEQISNELLMRVDYFKLEALISLGKIKESYEFINIIIENNNKDNFRIDSFCNNNFNLLNEFQLKSYLEIGKIFLLCKENKFKEAEDKLLILIHDIYINKDIDIPQYFSNLLLYIYLKQNKKKEALEFLKYKNIISKKEE